MLDRERPRERERKRRKQDAEPGNIRRDRETESERKEATETGKDKNQKCFSNKFRYCAEIGHRENSHFDSSNSYLLLIFHNTWFALKISHKKYLII